MKNLAAIGLLALLMASSSTPTSALPKRSCVSPVIAATPVVTPTLPSRDVFYFSDRFGFRFIAPSGYVEQTVSVAPSTKPSPPLQVLEFWQQADFWNREQLPEAPPVIRLTVYNNVQRLPLANWKGELSKSDDRPCTVGGQAAIAYSATGLYESDNVLVSSPDGRYVFRLQAGYRDANDPIRQTFQATVSSFTFDVIAKANASSQWRINYKPLQHFLAAKNWQAADLETRAILQRSLRLAGGNQDFLFGSKSVFDRLPAEDLHMLDTLWSKASNGRFGYKAQQRLWQNTASIKSPKARVERFAQTVGWRRTQPLPEENPVAMEIAGTRWRLDTELNYTAAAPIGHFPWAGVSSSRLTDLLNEMGCGSCTTDVIYLVNDRYYDYLPALFTKLNASRPKQ